MTINFHVVPRIENQTNGKFPGVPVPLNCCEYTWPPPVTVLHSPPHIWSQDSGNERARHTWQARVSRGNHLVPLPLTMPTHKALTFLLMSRAIFTQSTEGKTQIMA